MRPRPARARTIAHAFEALFWLSWARLFVTRAPFPRVATFLGKPGGDLSDEERAADPRRALEVQAGVRLVCRSLGWRPSCLVRAVAATAMLRRRGLPSTCYFGVQPGIDAALRAHAWVTHGPVFVVGGRCRTRYREIHHFSSVSARGNAAR